MPLHPGQRVAHYRIVEKIGEGGMGEVWKAVDTTLDREVAIKVLPAAFAADAERMARFEREAKLLASLKHTNIAVAHGLHEADGARFLVMELAPGEDLSRRLQRGALPLEEALPIARQITSALETAHEQGVVHRDLKPANVQIAPDDTIKVLDFGLAKALDDATAPASLTQSPTVTSAATRAGAIMGTAAYMSPEQARGKPVDRRSDIWAFGCVLYEMLTGRRAFDEESMSETLASLLRSEPDWSALPASTPASLRRLLQQSLRKDPQRRLQSVGDARVVLEDLIELGGGAEKVTQGPAEPIARTPPAPRWPWLVGALVLGLAGFLAGRSGVGPAPPPAETAATFSYRQITYQTGIETSPSLSPDGAFVAYTAVEGGDEDIFLQRVDGRRPINLTEGSPLDDDHAAFSHDGRFIAFWSERAGGGLFIMGSTGEAVRKLTDFGDNPSWSPDSSEIVFATEGESDPFARSTNSQLWIVDVASGETRLLHEGDAVQPSWSPDGRRIAYWMSDNGIRNVMTLPATGGEPVPVTTETSVDWGPFWDPDGTGLYFESDRAGVMNLWRVGVDTGTGALSGKPRPVLLPSFLSGPVALSGDGRQIAYVPGSGRSRVEMLGLDPQTGMPTAMAEAVLELSSLAAEIDLSPDGERIVFRTGNMQEDLFVVNADGTGMRKLTDDAHKDRGPRWAPDGKTIAFYSNRSGRYEIWTINTESGVLSPVTETAEIGDEIGEILWFPVWSSDGKEMLVSSPDTIYRLSVENLPAVPGDLQPIPVPPRDGHFFVPLSWSPTGKQVAGAWIATELGTARSGIGILDLASGVIKDVAPSLVMEDAHSWPSLAWLPDGRRGLACDDRGLVLIDTGSGELRRLGSEGTGPVHQAAWSNARVGVSADGTRAIVLKKAIESDIWLATRD